MRFFLNLLFIFFSTYICAQEPTYKIIGADTFDGIQLYSILQDDDETMWIATGKGLYHYDGISFTSIEMSEEIMSTDLFELTKDKNGDIYCVNLMGKIFKVVHNKLELFYSIPKEKLGSYTYFDFNNNNELIINTSGNVYLLNSGQQLNTIDEGGIYLLKKHNDNFYYLKHYKKEQYTKIKTIVNNKPVCVDSFEVIKNQKDIRGNLFIVNEQFYGFDSMHGGMFQLDNSSLNEKKLSFVHSRGLRCYNTKDDFWFSDPQNGVYKINSKKLEQEQDTTSKWFKDYYISGVYVDKEENTWLLTFNKGILIMPKTTVVNYSSQLENSKVVGVSKYNNSILVGTQKGIIYQLGNGKFEIYLETDGDRLEFMKVYDEQNLLVTSGGIYKNKQLIHKLPFTRDAYLINDTLYTAEYSGVGKTIFSTNGLKEDEGVLDYRTRSYSIAEGAVKGEFYVITTNSLEYVANDSYESIMYNGKHLNVTNLCKVEDEIWATSQEGIYVLKNKKVDRVITEKDGSLTQKLIDLRYEKPYVYMSSRKGMQRYNTITESLKSVTKSDGIKYGIITYEVLDDVVYAVNGEDLISFKFKDDSDEAFPTIQTRFKNVIVNGDYSIQEQAKLKPNENNIEFSYYTPTYKYQNNLTYEYQLKGFEKRAIQAKDNQYFVNYSNLPAGNYTFIVNSYIDGNKNSTAEFPLTIKKHWYDTFGFTLTVVAFSLLMIYSIYRVRLNSIERKREREEMKKRLVDSSLTSLKAQMNPHFLFNSMNSIQSLILKKETTTAYQYLTKLSDLVRENLNMSETSFVPFYKELYLIKEYLLLEQLRFKDTFKFDIKNTIDDVEIFIPSMIIQPFIENAVKHGLLHKQNNRYLLIEFYKENEQIICVVTDNGIGRKASERLNKKRKYKSFSTNAIEKRYTILREYYNINLSFNYEDLYENGKATGTKVLIKIPYTEENIYEN